MGPYGAGGFLHNAGSGQEKGEIGAKKPPFWGKQPTKQPKTTKKPARFGGVLQCFGVGSAAVPDLGPSAVPKQEGVVWE